MSEMVERVAKALFLKDGFPETHWTVIVDGDRNEYREVVRTVISEMRKPTKEMIEAPTRADESDEATVANWEAMIDEALK